MRVLLTIVAALALSAPVGAADPVTRVFSAWTVTCDAANYCAATTPPLGATRRDALRIARHAEQSYWEVALIAPTYAPDEWNDFVIAVDGAETAFALSEDVGAYGRPTDFYFLGDKAQQVMDQLMPAREVAIGFTDISGSAQTARFDLSGLTAALIWIDDKQNRIGSERVAAAPPHGLVPARSGTEGPPEIPIALLDQHRADPGCEPFEQLANGRDFEVGDLGDGATVYVIPCWSGAYNFGAKIYVSDGNTFVPQYFAEFAGDDGWVGTPFLVNTGFDPTTRELTSYGKARGIGDCGSSGAWRWTGYVFALVEFRYQACTDGPIDEDAELEAFPLVYPAPEATQ